MLWKFRKYLAFFINKIHFEIYISVEDKKLSEQNAEC